VEGLILLGEKISSVRDRQVDLRGAYLKGRSKRNRDIYQRLFRNGLCALAQKLINFSYYFRENPT